MGTEVKYVVRNVAASDVKVGDMVTWGAQYSAHTVVAINEGEIEVGNPSFVIRTGEAKYSIGHVLDKNTDSLAIVLEQKLLPEVGDYVEPLRDGVDTRAGTLYAITDIDSDGRVVFEDSIGDARRWAFPRSDWRLVKRAVKLGVPAQEPADEPSAAPLDVQIGGSHYKDMAIQPLEYCLANAIPFAEGNVIKYVSRWRKKNGVQDLKKARHMLDVLIAQAEEEASA